MRVLVVGGAGFIGSHLVDRLLAESHTVDVVDDLSTGTLGNLADARAAGGDLKIHHLDACAPEFGQLVAMREPEVIYHLGWAPPGRFDASVAARAIQSTLNVLDAAVATDVTKVVTALPAGKLYGEVPARELPVKEGRTWAPVGAAGVVARAVAELFTVYRERDEVEFSALALANVYGPRQRPDGGVVAAFAAALEHLRAGDAAADEARNAEAADGVASPATAVLHGDGRQGRDFVYIDDVVDAFVRSAVRGSGLVVNIGTGVLTSLRDLWSAMAGPGVPLPPATSPRPDDVSRVALAGTRARIHLAWAPWTSLDEGVASLRSGHPGRT